MIRIIEVPVEMIAKCSHCHAKIGYQMTDVQRREGTDIGGGPDGCTYIMCPACAKKIVLESWLRSSL